jgi:uncharacterized protein (DUF1697 family)
MTSYVALLRGINVGGKNLVAMREVAAAFRDAGYGNVRTHGQSGNVLFETDHGGGLELETSIETFLHQRCALPMLVVVRSREELAATVAAAPPNHGSDLLRSDVFFLKSPLTAHIVFAKLPELRQGVDSMSPGPGVLYFSRVAAQATKTRVQRVFAMPEFQQMTVRTWKVTTRLLTMLDEP